MTSTNDGKEVKSNQTSGQKGKSYYIELYKSLETRLAEPGSASQRTRAVCEAWRRVHSLCQHSAPSTHPHLHAWIQRHTSQTILQTDWRQSDNKEEQHGWLQEAIDAFIAECNEVITRNGVAADWESLLLERAQWFRAVLKDPWGHPVLKALVNSQGDELTDKEVLEWLKEEKDITFVTRLRQLAASRSCMDLALRLATAVMDRARATEGASTAVEQTDIPTPSQTTTKSQFVTTLENEAGFTSEVWDFVKDIEFVLLYSESRSRCIDLAKQQPHSNAYELVERLRNRLERSPRDKKVWKNAKEVATLIAQVVIARCMVVPTCSGETRIALYGCARSLVRLLPADKLPNAAAALAAPAVTARHLHTLALAIHTEYKNERKSFVCELYVRAITAGMNELERLKIKTDKEAEARSTEKVLSTWFTQLSSLLSASARMSCECILTAFSVHPTPSMYEQVKIAPPLEPLLKDVQEPKADTNSEYGSWATDSRTQTNLVKTSETLNLKTQKQTNVLSTAMFTEGEALGLEAELCQDLAVLISGPRVKTLSWDMDRESLLENCRTYMKRTHGGTRALTTELKYLNLDPRSFQHLPEEDDDENDLYYGIEKGYEHLLESPEEIWQNSSDDPEHTDSARSNEECVIDIPKRKKKSKRSCYVEEVDPLSMTEETNRTEPQERPHSKERSKERRRKKHDMKEGQSKDEYNQEISQKEKKKERRERKKKEKYETNKDTFMQNSEGNLSKLVGLKVCRVADDDSQGKSSINSECNNPSIIEDNFSIDDMQRNMYQYKELCLYKGVVSKEKTHKIPDKQKSLSLIKNSAHGKFSPYKPEMHVSEEVKRSIKQFVEMKQNHRYTVEPILRPHENHYPLNFTEKYSPASVNDNYIRGRSQTPNLQPKGNLIMNREKQLSSLKNEVNNVLKKYSNQGNSVQQKFSNVTVETFIPSSLSNERNKFKVDDKKSAQIGVKSSTVAQHAVQNSNLNMPLNHLLSNTVKSSLLKKNESPSQCQFKEFLKQRSTNTTQTITKLPIRNTFDTPSQIQFQEFLRLQNSSEHTSPLNNTKDVIQHFSQDYSMPITTAHKNVHTSYNKDRIKKEDKQYPSVSLQNIARQVSPNITENQKQYQHFLKELMEATNAGAVNDRSEINQPGFDKDNSNQYRKADNALNTFSRLSYLHKNKQNDNRHRLPLDRSSHPQSMSMEELRTLDINYSKVSNTQSKGEVALLRTDKTNPINENKKNVANSTITNLHPIVSNMLSSDFRYHGSDMVQKEVNNVENRNVSVGTSHLSDKDQNDLLLLLQQKSKMNIRSNNDNITGTNPKTSNSIKSEINDLSQSSHNLHLDLSRSEISRTDKPVIKTSDSVKSSTTSELKKVRTVKASSKNIKHISKENDVANSDWESVMNALLAQKTPSRGPNALDIVLKKDSFEKRIANKTAENPKAANSSHARINKITECGDLKTSLIKKDHTHDFKEHQDKKITNLDSNIRANRKITPKMKDKQFLNFIQNGTDPFISGLPNSDFDLLGELMDDDLRKEIGELLDDDDVYGLGMSTTKTKSVMHNKKNPVTSQKPQIIIDTRPNLNSENSTLKLDKNLQSKSNDVFKTIIQEKSTSKLTTPNISNQPQVICDKLIVPVSAQKSSCKLSGDSRPNQIVKPITNFAEKNSCLLTANKCNNANEIIEVKMPKLQTCNFDILEPPKVVLAVPQPAVPNVMLISNELVYKPLTVEVKQPEPQTQNQYAVNNYVKFNQSSSNYLAISQSSGSYVGVTQPSGGYVAVSQPSGSYVAVAQPAGYMAVTHPTGSYVEVHQTSIVTPHYPVSINTAVTASVMQRLPQNIPLVNSSPVDILVSENRTKLKCTKLQFGETISKIKEINISEESKIKSYSNNDINISRDSPERSLVRLNATVAEENVTVSSTVTEPLVSVSGPVALTSAVNTHKARVSKETIRKDSEFLNSSLVEMNRVVPEKNVAMSSKVIDPTITVHVPLVPTPTVSVHKPRNSTESIRKDSEPPSREILDSSLVNVSQKNITTSSKVTERTVTVPVPFVSVQRLRVSTESARKDSEASQEILDSFSKKVNLKEPEKHIAISSKVIEPTVTASELLVPTPPVSVHKPRISTESIRKDSEPPSRDILDSSLVNVPQTNITTSSKVTERTVTVPVPIVSVQRLKVSTESARKDSEASREILDSSLVKVPQTNITTSSKVTERTVSVPVPIVSVQRLKVSTESARKDSEASREILDSSLVKVPQTNITTSSKVTERTVSAPVPIVSVQRLKVSTESARKNSEVSREILDSFSIKMNLKEPEKHVTISSKVSAKESARKDSEASREILDSFSIKVNLKEPEKHVTISSKVIEPTVTAPEPLVPTATGSKHKSSDSTESLQKAPEPSQDCLDSSSGKVNPEVPEKYVTISSTVAECPVPDSVLKPITSASKHRVTTVTVLKDSVPSDVTTSIDRSNQSDCVKNIFPSNDKIEKCKKSNDKINKKHVDFKFDKRFEDENKITIRDQERIKQKRILLKNRLNHHYYCRNEPIALNYEPIYLQIKNKVIESNLKSEETTKSESSKDSKNEKNIIDPVRTNENKNIIENTSPEMLIKAPNKNINITALSELPCRRILLRSSNSLETTVPVSISSSLKNTKVIKPKSLQKIERKVKLKTKWLKKDKVVSPMKNTNSLDLLKNDLIINKIEQNILNKVEEKSEVTHLPEEDLEAQIAPSVIKIPSKINNIKIVDNGGSSEHKQVTPISQITETTSSSSHESNILQGNNPNSNNKTNTSKNKILQQDNRRLINSKDIIENKNYKKAISNKANNGKKMHAGKVYPHVTSNNITTPTNSENLTNSSEVSKNKNFSKYKEKIIFEELPNVTNDPYKKCIRIKLPGKHAFKATISGKLNINIDSLFEEPAIKSMILKNINNNKKCTLNVKQLVVNGSGNKSADTTQPENRLIIRNKTRGSAFTNPAGDLSSRSKNIVASRTIITQVRDLSRLVIKETIDLISDDEENPVQTFKTEFGNFNSASMNKDVFLKHQRKFSQKCEVKVGKCDFVQERLKLKLTKEVISIKEKPLLPCEQNTDIIEIDDSSNDSEINARKFDLASVNVKDDMKITKLTDKVEVLKDLLLNDLGVKDSIEKSNVNKSNVQTQNRVDKNISFINAELHKVKSKECVLKLDKCDDLIEKMKIQKNMCFVSLVRCDSLVRNTNPLNELSKLENAEQSQTEVDTKMESVKEKQILRRSGSISILNDISAIAEVKSPSLIENLETPLNLPNNLNIKTSFNNSTTTYICNAEWYMTKVYLLNLHKQTSINSNNSGFIAENEKSLLDDKSTDCDSDIENNIFADESFITKETLHKEGQLYQVSSLVKLVTNFFANNDSIIERLQTRQECSKMVLYSSPLKRKYEEVVDKHRQKISKQENCNSSVGSKSKKENLKQEFLQHKINNYGEQCSNSICDSKKYVQPFEINNLTQDEVSNIEKNQENNLLNFRKNRIGLDCHIAKNNHVEPVEKKLDMSKQIHQIKYTTQYKEMNLEENIVNRNDINSSYDKPVDVEESVNIIRLEGIRDVSDTNLVNGSDLTVISKLQDKSRNVNQLEPKIIQGSSVNKTKNEEFECNEKKQTKEGFEHKTFKSLQKTVEEQKKCDPKLSCSLLNTCIPLITEIEEKHSNQINLNNSNIVKMNLKNCRSVQQNHKYSVSTCNKIADTEKGNVLDHADNKNFEHHIPQSGCKLDLGLGNDLVEAITPLNEVETTEIGDLENATVINKAVLEDQATQDSKEVHKFTKKYKCDESYTVEDSSNKPSNKVIATLGTNRSPLAFPRTESKENFEKNNEARTKGSTDNGLQENITLVYNGDSLKGSIYENPIVGKCYLFCDNICNDNSHNVIQALKSKIFEDRHKDMKSENTVTKNIKFDDVIIPKFTYSRQRIKNEKINNYKSVEDLLKSKSLKRKIDSCENNLSKRYRKGKNIDYPNLTDTSMSNTSYRKEYKRLFNYWSSIKFSFTRPFHIEYLDVSGILKCWPITEMHMDVSYLPENEKNLYLDNNLKEKGSSDPLKQTLAEEILSAHVEPQSNCDEINENNFSMGFGERSDRVIQNSGDRDIISKFSAATLSDVKQSQPFLVSEDNDRCNEFYKSKLEQLDIQKRYYSTIQIRDKVRSFFRKTTLDLHHNWLEENVKNKSGTLEYCDKNEGLFPYDLFNPDFIEPAPIEATVNVVQVGQLPVSAAAQNPVTCDPRVTQVTDASPSQCSAENSPHEDLQCPIKTEYTELTTADLNVPLVQEYKHHIESQESSNVPNDYENIPVKIEVTSEDKSDGLCEIKDEPNTSDNESDDLHSLVNKQYMNKFDYSLDSKDKNTLEAQSNPESMEKHNSDTILQQKQQNGSAEKADKIAHAMNAAGITNSPEPSIPENTTKQTLVNMFSQKISQEVPGSTPQNNFAKASINTMTLQQALAQILPPPLNQTNSQEINHVISNSPVASQVLHIVQGKNTNGSQITVVDNTQNSVISNSGTPVLHIVHNKGVNPTPNSTTVQHGNTYSGLSLVDAGLQQGSNQLLHIVNAGTQKNNATGQLLKRVNLLTNLTNVQGSNEQKMVQFVCKSADGKSIQLNAPHQRSMVLRLQPFESPSIQSNLKTSENQDLSPLSNTDGPALNKESNNAQHEIKSRSVYEENYAKFIQNSSNKTIPEKSTSLPKFNQAFGKQVFQDGNQKPNDTSTNNTHLSSDTENECRPSENTINLDHIGQINSPPLLLRKSPAQTAQTHPNIMHQIKQTITPMMHGGVIYTRQIPVNIGGGQTINLITVPSTELNDDSNQKQHGDLKFINQGEIDSPIIKIVPQNQSTDMKSEECDNHQSSTTNENGQNTVTQHQPILTQMRIKLPMLSKTPQMVSGARMVRPSFFQIQRNVIGGANQPVYQQLVLTAAPPLSQHTIRIPHVHTRQVKVTENQSSSESQMSSSTLEQLREFDMVLEQVKERSTVQPNCTNNFTKLNKSSDTTDSVSVTSTVTESAQQVLYSIGANPSLNVAYVNRKQNATATPSTAFVRSPDTSGILETPSSAHVKIPRTVTSKSTSNDAPAQQNPPKPAKVGSKSKSRSKSSHPPNSLKINTVPPKTSSHKPLEDEQTTQRILYILAEYKQKVQKSPHKNKPAPRRRTNPPSNPPGTSKRKKSSSSSRRSAARDVSPIHGEDTCRTMGSEDSSCGTSQGDCAESCLESHSPQDSPRKVVRKLSFENEISNTTQPRTQQQRNVIVADGPTITVSRGSSGKPATAVLMPANYILPVSMVKGGQQIAIVTNRGPKLLTVGGGEGGTNALLLQRLIGPAGLKPVLTRPGVRHVRLPTSALHNLQAFNLATATTVHSQDSATSPSPAPTPPELIETRPSGSPWGDRESQDVKPDRGSSPEGSEPWLLTADPNDYSYEETVRTENIDRTVLDAIPDRYSPDMEAQRIFDKMFDVDSKKSYLVDSQDDSSRCAYDIDASDCDDKAYHQVVQKKYGHRQHRLAHVSAAALRHKYAMLEHELRLQGSGFLQKSLSEECEDLGVDSPSASELFPEAELLFNSSPAHEAQQQSQTPQPTILNQSGISLPDLDDHIAADLLRHEVHGNQEDLGVTLGLDEGIVTVSEDGMQATVTVDQEEFARSHPNTTFHSEPTEPEEGEVQPVTITDINGRHITSTIFHAGRAPATVLVTAPQPTVISQATQENLPNNIKYANIEHIINAPSTHRNLNLSTVLVKEDGLTKFDNILTDSREIHLSNTASAIIHSTGNATQVIRRVCYEHDERRRDTRYLMDEADGVIAGDDAKMITEDSSRHATLGAMADVDEGNSSPERHTELFWESNSASERSEGRRPLDFSSDSEKCCKSPFEETNSTDSSGVGTHVRLDSVIKEARLIDRAGSGSSDDHPPLRTYPAKRYHIQDGDVERSLTGKTRAGFQIDRSESHEVRRRASGRGVVKRGCHCCNGSPAPLRPKKSKKKPTMDFNSN